MRAATATGCGKGRRLQSFSKNQEFNRCEEKPKAKLSYKETRELEALPKEIEALEAEQQALAAKMHAPEYYKQPPDVLRADQQRSAEIENCC